MMLAACVASFDAERPLRGLSVGERPLPKPRTGWTRVRVEAASLNHRDLSCLRGGEPMRRRGKAGVTEADLPRILGCDGAGVTEDGREVVIYPVVAGPEGSAMLSGGYDGTLAEYVLVPDENLIPKPAAMSFETAACLPTAWLTAFRMLFEKVSLPEDGTVLVQGATGGLATALVMLAKAAGYRVWATSRSPGGRDFALSIGADAAFAPGSRLPQRVDAVMDSVGAPTWAHSLKCLRRGGTMVVPGATAGYEATVDIATLFTMDLTIVGSAMGSRRQLADLLAMVVGAGLVPPVDHVLPLAEVSYGLAALEGGDLRGKVVVRPFPPRKPGPLSRADAAPRVGAPRGMT